jgi:hypothetical protein
MMAGSSRTRCSISPHSPSPLDHLALTPFRTFTIFRWSPCPPTAQDRLTRTCNLLGLKKHVNLSFVLPNPFRLSSLRVPDAVVSRSAPFQVSDPPGYSQLGRYRLRTRWNRPFTSETPSHSLLIVSLTFHTSITFLFRPARPIRLALEPVHPPLFTAVPSHHLGRP